MVKFNFPFRSQDSKILNWKRQSPGLFVGEKGQALITWLVLLSLFCVACLSLGSGYILLRDRMQLLNICRLDSLETQRRVEPLIRNLFNLNSQARFLRLMLYEAEAELTLAISTYNYPLAAKATGRIRQIRNQQRVLDRTQTGLITSSNILLQSGALSTYAKLSRSFSELSQQDSHFADVHFFLQTPKIPRLAVKKEDNDLAPPYLVREDFEKHQAISQSWNNQYTIKGLLNFHHQSTTQCGATLEEETWTPKIRKDRPYWRWF